MRGFAIGAALLFVLFVAIFTFILIQSAAHFEQQISVIDTERGIFKAIHVSEELRRFSETAMKYSLNRAIPKALEGGGNPGNYSYSGMPVLGHVRYWGWCESRRDDDDITGPVDCSNADCGYASLSIGEDALLSDGIAYSVGSLLGDYSDKFMARQQFSSSIEPSGSSISVDLGSDEVTYSTDVDANVVMLPYSGSMLVSEGAINSRDTFSSTITASGMEDILTAGKDALNDIAGSHIATAADYADSLDNGDNYFWISNFVQKLNTLYSPGAYAFYADVVKFENETGCADVTINVTLRSTSSTYSLYQGGALSLEPLNLTFLVQKRVTR